MIAYINIARLLKETMRVSIFCLLCAQRALASLYFKYPDSIGPDSTVLNVDGSDYLITSAELSLPADVIENYNREELLDRYKISDNYIGFVFDESAAVQQVVKARVGNRGVGNIKMMKTMDSGWTYYEKRPLVTNNTVYIEKFFDFRDDHQAPRGANPEDWCMVTLAPERPHPEEYCRKFPRCLGVLKYTNKSNVCLVGNAALTQGAGPTDAYTFAEKKLRHDIFVTMGENGVLLGVLSGLAVAVQILVPFGLNTSVISRVTGRLTGGAAAPSPAPAEVKANVKVNNYDF